MEWVETTGKTIEEAKEAALDQLGVDEEEAEFEVVEEPKSGLFGRVRREARIRARIRPKRPRPKGDRRDRRRKNSSAPGDTNGSVKGSRSGGSKGGSRSGGSKGGRKSGQESGSAGSASVGNKTRQKSQAERGAETEEGKNAVTTNRMQPEPSRSSVPKQLHVEGETGNQDPTQRDRWHRGQEHRDQREQRDEGEQMTSESVTTDEQATIIEEFLEGLAAAFGSEVEITREIIDDDLIEVRLEASDLGLLIGPKGQTLGAIQELARTVLQRKATGLYEGRVRVDIGGYRDRRRAALERFANSVAQQVRSSGKKKVLEPMHPADRKVVHDTVNGIDGVATSSEGTEPYRRVVVRPSD